METSTLHLAYLEKHVTIEFAAQELKRIIGRIAPAIHTGVHHVSTYNSSKLNTIWIGLTESFNFSKPVSNTSACETPFDDVIHIEMGETGGFITGNNPRSVLLAVYRYLTEQGCRWIRPGKDGEFIPDHLPNLKAVKLSEAPSYRHRGICIEGAFSYENLEETIDWLPKVGFNSFYIQFREGYTFFDRWYSHTNNPTKEAEPFSIEKARDLIREAEEEVKKRDLVYHAVGHGWTCEPLGLPGLGWDPVEYEISPENKEFLALVNGERQVWQNIALNTNLCYSNPKVQELMINEIIQYIEAHRDIDILHFWLADLYNNQCECENCRDTLPSDFYVQMLNELDRILTSKKIDTRIVFLIYFELLWPPIKERIENEDRYILMFAPITRTYSREFSDEGQTFSIPPYERNKISFSSATEDNLAYLKAWQKVFNGDSFIFEYHMMWDHYADQGYYSTADIIYKDIQNLRSMGLQGYISCQVLRAFLPTGLNMMVLARTLWDSRIQFEDIVNDYFTHAFGPDAQACLNYMQELSKLFDPAYLREEKEKVNAVQAEQFSSIPQVISDFKPVIEKNRKLQNQIQAKSWEYLATHAEIATLFARTLEAKARGDEELLKERWIQLTSYVQENEDAIQPVFDVFEFIHIGKARVMEEFRFF
jgi:hypothetical protein